MKKTIAILLIIAMLLASALAIIPVSAATNGVAIRSAADFANMKADGMYYLANNVVISSSYANEFRGTLDGNGNTVTLRGATPLFEKINGGSVADLNIVMSFSAEEPGGDFGALARTANGTFERINVDIEATFTAKATANNIGGVFGYINGATIINDVIASGSIVQTVSNPENNNYINNGCGGIVAIANTNAFLKIKNCINYIDLYGNLYSMSAGGMVGVSTGNTQVTISDSQNYGEIDISGSKSSSSSNHMGAAGFVGAVHANNHSDASVEIYSSRNYGEITYHGDGQANLHRGGFIGRAWGCSKIIVDGCVNSGEINKDSNYGWTSNGGIIGNIGVYNLAWSKNTTADIQVLNCVNIGYISQATYAGGILGSVFQANSFDIEVGIYACANYAEVNNGAGILGLLGNQSACKLVVSSCYNAGKAQSGVVGTIAQSYEKNNIYSDAACIGKENSYRVPEIIRCINEGVVNYGVIKQYSFATYEDLLGVAYPELPGKVSVIDCVTNSGNITPVGDEYEVEDSCNPADVTLLIKTSVPGNPTELDKTLAISEKYAGYEAEDFANGWKEFEYYYRKSLEVANKATVQNDLDDYAEALEVATSCLVWADVDTDSLENAVNAAASKIDALGGDGSAYTPLSWETLEAAFENAKVTLALAKNGDNSIRASVVSNATKKLTEALNGLSLIPDKIDLRNYIDTFEAYEQSKYETRTWETFIETIENAKIVYNDINATQTEVELAISNMIEAASELLEKGKFDDIDSLLEPFGEVISYDSNNPKVNNDRFKELEKQYTKESLKDFEKAVKEVANAKKKDNQGKFSDTDAEELYIDLKKAIDALVPIVSYDRIDQIIGEINSLDRSAYTEESWNTLQEALGIVEDLRANGNPTQAEIDAAIERINAAYKNLVNGSELSQEDINAAIDDVMNNYEYIDFGCQSALGTTLAVLCATLSLGATVVLRKKED